ncbi:MAG: ParB/RepB/Spo0J family partition protein [Sumerlaeia bacterium]
MSKARKALGRGLGPLLGTLSDPKAAAAEAVPIEPPGSDPRPAQPGEVAPGDLAYIELGKIRRNPHQPREDFDPERLAELSASIKKNGVLQPILVMPDLEEGPGRWILLAGERRMRASQEAGLTTIPARVIDVTEEQMLELAIVENVQREDLNPVEEARAYDRLTHLFGYSQDDVAERVGKSRTAVANTLRLLKLPENALRDLEEGILTPGHARAILSLPETAQQETLRREILRNGLSVREAERLAKKIAAGKFGPRAKAKTPGEQSLDVVNLEEKLLLRLGCKVRVKSRSASTGAIEIAYASLDDLDRVLDILQVSPDDD